MDYTMKNLMLTKNTVSAIKPAKMLDFKVLLELLHTNNDVNMQVKLLSTLSAYLLSNEANIDVLITYNSLYDKICNILSHCPPKRATVAFNFLSALIYNDDEDSRRKKSLIVYAKNRIRSSGCLATMCEFFTSSMMHQDAWRSLCRCLAETCREVEANQSYCTHLVPMCIKRCSQRNTEVVLVLQSLLQNHARNVKLFIECGGISIFQRELLQLDICLQLLNTVVLSSEEAIQLIKKTDICQHLRDFLHLYGPQSQLGQWATIILYHISGTKGTSEVQPGNQAVNNKPTNLTINHSIVGDSELNCTTNTTRFFQNVMQEILRCSPPIDLNSRQGFLPAQTFHMQRNAFTCQGLTRNQLQTSKRNIITAEHNSAHPENNNISFRKEYRKISKANDLSFSFLQNDNNRTRLSKPAYLAASKLTESLQKTNITNATYTRKPSNLYQSAERDNKSRHYTPELSNFEPKFVSTPKRHTVEPNTTTRQYTQNSILKSMVNSTKQRAKKRIQKRNNSFKPVRNSKRLEKTLVTEKDNKHRSISGWFFEAINESCTTLVKTVKNIFRPKNNSEETNEKSTSSVSDAASLSCRYSFTNYMHKRDAILKNECSKKSDVPDCSMQFSDACNTCNDTLALKYKLENDEYLKQTVRKLKLGINLYGCDFKKISKQLWPQQTYMTPVVLYNLYRKLIIK